MKLGYNEQLGTDQFSSLVGYTGVRYNQVNLCTKITNLTRKSVRYNRVFVNNRVRYNRVSLYIRVLLFVHSSYSFVLISANFCATYNECGLTLVATTYLTYAFVQVNYHFKDQRCPLVYPTGSGIAVKSETWRQGTAARTATATTSRQAKLRKSQVRIH